MHCPGSVLPKPLQAQMPREGQKSSQASEDLKKPGPSARRWSAVTPEEKKAGNLFQIGDIMTVV